MTNREVFKKTFGFNPEHCVAPARVCEEMNMKCRECLFDTFWDREYKECFRIKEEYEKQIEEGDPYRDDYENDERQRALINILKRHRKWTDE